LGLDSSLDPAKRVNHQHGGEEVASELIVSRGDPPPILGAAEEILDLVPLA
jgi:hypothetical protein